MKKSLIVISICVLIASFSVVSAVNTSNLRIKQNQEKNVKFLEDNTDVPLWIDGTFEGKWGLREYDPFLDTFQDLFGEEDDDKLIEFTIGNISGYYREIFNMAYYFKGFAYYTNETGNETLATTFSGLAIGHIVGGKIGDVNMSVEPEDGNTDYLLEFSEANYCGIGGYNNTNFDWRIMSFKGPTLFLKGNISPLK